MGVFGRKDQNGNWIPDDVGAQQRGEARGVLADAVERRNPAWLQAKQAATYASPKEVLQYGVGPIALPRLKPINRSGEQSQVLSTPKAINQNSTGGGTPTEESRPLPVLPQENEEQSGGFMDKVKAFGQSARGGLTSFNADWAGLLAAADSTVSETLAPGSEHSDFFYPKVIKPYLDEDKYRQALIQAEIDKGNLNPVVNDITQGVVKAIPSALLAIMSGGTSLGAQAGISVQAAAPGAWQMAQQAATQLAHNPNFWASMGTNFGGAYNEAIESGASNGQAISAAALQAIPSSIIEVSGGTEQLVGRLMREEATEGALRAVARSALEEGAEEILQYPFEGLAQKATYAPETPWFSTEETAVINPKEQAYAGAMGAASGAILGGATTAVNAGLNAMSNGRLRTGAEQAEHDSTPENQINEKQPSIASDVQTPQTQTSETISGTASYSPNIAQENDAPLSLRNEIDNYNKLLYDESKGSDLGEYKDDPGGERAGVRSEGGEAPQGVQRDYGEIPPEKRQLESMVRLGNTERQGPGFFEDDGDRGGRPGRLLTGQDVPPPDGEYSRGNSFDQYLELLKSQNAEEGGKPLLTGAEMEGVKEYDSEAQRTLLRDLPADWPGAPRGGSEGENARGRSGDAGVFEENQAGVSSVLELTRSGGDSERIRFDEITPGLGEGAKEYDRENQRTLLPDSQADWPGGRREGLDAQDAGGSGGNAQVPRGVQSSVSRILELTRGGGDSERIRFDEITPDLYQDTHRAMAGMARQYGDELHIMPVEGTYEADGQENRIASGEAFCDPESGHIFAAEDAEGFLHHEVYHTKVVSQARDTKRFARRMAMLCNQNGEPFQKYRDKVKSNYSGRPIAFDDVMEEFCADTYNLVMLDEDRARKVLRRYFPDQQSLERAIALSKELDETFRSENGGKNLPTGWSGESDPFKRYLGAEQTAEEPVGGRPLLTGEEAVQASAKQEAEGAEPSRTVQSKSQKVQARREKRFLDKMAHVLSIPKEAQRAQMKPRVHELFERLKVGDGTYADIDALFHSMYDSGVQVLDDYYNQYKPLKDELRRARLQISQQDRADIADFEQFRRDNRGTLQIVEPGGIPVDSKYQELMEQYPELFPADVTAPADQIQTISQVAKGVQKAEQSLNEYYGEDADRFRTYARYEFDKEMERLQQDAWEVQRYEQERAAAQQGEAPRLLTFAEVKQAYEDAERLRRASGRTAENELLTDKDRTFLDLLMKGKIEPDDLPEGLNKEGIMRLYADRKQMQDVQKPIEEYNRQRKENLKRSSEKLIEGSDQWKEKLMGLQYAVNPMERNAIDVAGPVEGKRLNEAIFEPVHRNEAAKTRELNAYRERVKKLNIGQKPLYEVAVALDDPTPAQLQHMNVDRYTRKVSESELIQLLGEGKITEQQVKASGAEVDKIKAGVKEFRTIYNELYQKVSDTQVRNGHAPLPYRKDYFPHFVEDVPASLMGKAMQKLGYDPAVTADKLPTNLSGITEIFRPGIRWFQNALRRTGQRTEYDALKGFDDYLSNALDIVYHTEDIQRVRALESALRYKYSDDGIQAEINDIENDPNLSDERKSTLLKEVYEREKDKGKFPHLVNELRRYGDSLAGKKDRADRQWEYNFGREIYHISKQMEGHVAANMVGANTSSWLTNFIPLTQATGEVKARYLLRGMHDTVRSYAVDDGFVDRSDFLTNRAGSDPLSKTWVRKASDFVNKPMEWIDQFTAGSIARGRYYQALESGMSEADALADSNRYTAALMADRSKGSMPTIFNAKNPITKTFTMFQLEVNNQLQYLMKDLPRNTRERLNAKWSNISQNTRGQVDTKQFNIRDGVKKKSAVGGAVAWSLTKIFVGAWLYNELYERLVGRRSALDPIDIVKDAILDFTDEDTPFSEAAGNLVKNVLEEVPFVGGVLGGGRVPIQSAIPNPGQLAKLLDRDVAGAKKADILVDELLKKPVTYLLPPFGGGALRKGIEGIQTVAGGGSYAMNNEGERQLEFPVIDPDAGDYLKAALFGKYALKTGQEYVENGFRKYTVKETARYEEAKERGIDPQGFLDLLDEFKQVETQRDSAGNITSTKTEQKRELLWESDAFNAEEKAWIDQALIQEGSNVDYSSSESYALSLMTGAQAERCREAMEYGMSVQAFQKYYTAIKGIHGVQGRDGKTIPGSVKENKIAMLMQMGMTREQAELFYEIAA